MAPEQSSQTEPHTVSPAQSSTSPSTQPREPSPLIHPSTNAVQQPYGLYPQSYGSHFVPYDQTAPQQLRQMQQQQQQAQMNQPNPQQPVTYMTVPQPFQHPPQSSRRKIAKDILHVLVMIVSIIGMGFAFSLLGKAMNRPYSSRYGYYYDSFDYYLPAVSVGPVFAVAFLWSLVELIVRCSRNWKAGIHPGAHVGVCLCLWLGAVIVGALLAVFVAQPWYYESCSSSSGSSDSYGSCSRYSDPMFVGSTVLALLLAAVEFILFVIACADTHVRNRWKRSVVIASTPYWAPPPQGWYVAPGQQQQQFVPMGQPPTTQVHPTMAAPAPVQTQPAAAAAAEMGGDEKGHAIREFYTPGTAQ
ncbi:hypothetical protein J3459_017163 [Metarhizium acridum]|nr:hypothetical protein J3459_017163 [Metarhizium acridum]